MISSASRWQLVVGAVSFVLGIALSIFADIRTVSTFIICGIGIGLVVSSFSSASLRTAEEVAESTSYSAGNWPIFLALAVPFLIFGATQHGEILIGAAVIALVGGLGWIGASWRAEEGFTAEFAESFSERIFRPILLPILALAIVAVVAISISRVLLAVTENSAVVIAISLATALIVVFAILATVKSVSAFELKVLAVTAGILVIVIGVISAVSGETKSEKHEAAPQLRFTTVNREFVRGVTGTKIRAVQAIAGEEVNVVLHNEEVETVTDSEHNVAFYKPLGNGKFEDIWNGPPAARGRSSRRVFDVPTEPGKYQFRCDFHPELMTGTLIVKDK